MGNNKALWRMVYVNGQAPYSCLLWRLRYPDSKLYQDGLTLTAYNNPIYMRAKFTHLHHGTWSQSCNSEAYSSGHKGVNRQFSQPNIILLRYYDLYASAF